MSGTLSKKSISVAGGTFLFALTSGLAIMFGMGGANAADSQACTVAKPVTSVTASGNNIITWSTTGNCEGVTVTLHMVDVKGVDNIVQTDDVSVDNQASFTYGAIPAGHVYDFKIQGTTEGTKTPVSLTTLTSQ